MQHIYERGGGETLLLSNFPPILNHAFCIKPCQAFKFKDDSTLFLALLISCGKIRKKRRRRKPWNFVIIEYRFSQTLYYYCEGNFASFPQISGHSHLHPHITALPDNFVHLTASYGIISRSTTWPQKSSIRESGISINRLQLKYFYIMPL